MAEESEPNEVKWALLKVATIGDLLISHIFEDDGCLRSRTDSIFTRPTLGKTRGKGIPLSPLIRARDFLHWRIGRAGASAHDASFMQAALLEAVAKRSDLPVEWPKLQSLPDRDGLYSYPANVPSSLARLRPAGRTALPRESPGSCLKQGRRRRQEGRCSWNDECGVVEVGPVDV